jgi:hypothetical protein
MKHFTFAGIAAASLLVAAAPDGSATHTKGRQVAPFTPTLKAGDYVWHPEASPAGPVVVLVSLPDQVLYVYRNGVHIGRSTVSTGKQGKRTPTGVFTVLQKKIRHESSIYKGAQMPHMQRLTWTGIALHAGQLPGYPASAGCVRMPVDFAAKLYSVTSLGTTVIIADNNSRPTSTTSPGFLFSAKTGAPSSGFNWTPEKAQKGPISIIVSGPDRAAYVERRRDRSGAGEWPRAVVRLVRLFRAWIGRCCRAARLDFDGERWRESTKPEGSGEAHLDSTFVPREPASDRHTGDDAHPH